MQRVVHSRLRGVARRSQRSTAHVKLSKIGSATLIALLHGTRRRQELRTCKSAGDDFGRPERPLLVRCFQMPQDSLRYTAS